MLQVLEGRALPCISSPRQLGHEGIQRVRLGFCFQNAGAYNTKVGVAHAESVLGGQKRVPGH